MEANFVCVHILLRWNPPFGVAEMDVVEYSCAAVQNEVHVLSH